MDRRITARLSTLVMAAALACGAAAAASPVAVWTQHNDNSRTGQNNRETTLTVRNVNKNTFGKLFSYPIDDQVYAQPLYIPALTIAGVAHNVVFVATVNNTLYAFDADDPTANSGQPLWSRGLTPVIDVLPVGVAAPRPPINRDIDGGNGWYNDFANKMGTVGTPVIDTAAGTMYIVSRYFYNGNFVQQLHAIDIHTGAERANSPVAISATFTGGGNTTTFDSLLHNQRAGLLLQNGKIYIAWASHGDFGDYHGWVMGYNASTLAQVGVWNSTPSGSMSSVWQSGQGLTTDAAGNIYFMTGNGTFDGTNNFGESVVKLSTNPTTGALSYADFFAPSDWDQLNAADADLGSAGILGIPGTKLILGGGKEGKLYLLNTDNLGQENSVDNVVQEFQATSPSSGQSGHIHGTPIYWKNASGQYIYVWGENDYLRQYQFTNGADANHGSFNTSAISHSPYRAPLYNGGMPGGFLSVTSNYGIAGTGIVWASTPFNDNANQQTVAGILSAFDATDVSRVLWTSKDFPSRDDVGQFAKFVPPTVSNGKVYIPSWGDGNGGPCQLDVYGLMPAPTAGTGLSVQYFNDDPNSTYPLTNPFTTAPVVSRVDPTINFDWNNDSPTPNITTDHFSARWTGEVLAPTTGTYTFYTTSDDGVRLWINGQLMVDEWINQGPTEWASPSISLAGGRKYDIRMEYFENGGGATAHLAWSGPGIAKQIVPQSSLYQASSLVQTVFHDASVNGGSPTLLGVVLSDTAPVSGVTVALSSADTKMIPVGTTITVPAGAKYNWIVVTPSAVSADTTVSATATLGTVTQTASIAVKAATLKTFTAPSAIGGGQSLVVTATLTAAAPAGGLSIPITSSAPPVTAGSVRAASVPVAGGTLTIPAGATSGSLRLSTVPVAADTPVTLTAQLGAVTLTSNVTVQAAFNQVVFHDAAVTGGSPTLLGITLYGPAGPGGLTVALSSADKRLVPDGTSITVPAGAKGAWLRVTPSVVTTSTAVSATATLGSMSKSASITVNPAR